MRSNLSTTSLLPLCLGIALSASVAAMAHEPMTSPEPAKMSATNDASMQLQHIMMPPTKMEMPMSGNVDKDFAVMMTMHHQQAIDMAEVIIQHGKSAELKAMARKMKADQQNEIQQLAKYTK